MPTGENQLCINSENTDYISTGAEGASSYTWTISPTEAGTISGEGTTATIDWSDTFVGEALISVSGQNECGQGLTSESLSVTISSCTGIETTEFYNIKIFPNPSNGIINIQSERNEQLQIEIINICGQLFYSAKIQNTKQIELESGIYLIRLSSSEFSTSKQVIINK